jgi:hypothetical protein
MSTGNVTAEPSKPPKSIEEQTLDLEREKFEAAKEWEAQKIAIERDKKKWTAVSIVASVVVASITIIASAYLQFAAAQKQFELKAADLTLQTNDPVVSETKGREIDTLYPGTLPNGWQATFRAENFFSESDDLKSEVAKLLIEHPECKDQILVIYGTLFQENKTQDFLKRIRDLDSGVHKQPNPVQHSPECKL